MSQTERCDKQQILWQSAQNVLRICCVGLLLLAAPSVAALQFSLELGSISHPKFLVEGLSIKMDVLKQGAANIMVNRLVVAGTEYIHLNVYCRQFEFDGHNLNCPQGIVRRSAAPGKERPELPFSLLWREQEKRLEFSLNNAPLVSLSPLVKGLRAWQPQGTIDLHLQYLADQAQLKILLKDVHFTHKKNPYTGERVQLQLLANAQYENETWNWQAELAWLEGKISLPPWKEIRSGMGIKAAGILAPKVVEVKSARLEVTGVGALNASLLWDKELGEAKRWGFVSEPLDLAVVMQDWVQPWLTSIGVPAWKVTGHALFSAEADQGKLKSVYGGLNDVTLSDATGFIYLNKVNAQLPWDALQANEGEITFASGKFGLLPMGAARLPVRLAHSSVTLHDIALPLLDGKLRIERLHMQRDESNKWHAEFAGGIDKLSLPALSKVLGWPELTGQLNAEVPAITLDEEALTFLGAVAITVFDGGITIYPFKVVHPFSVDRRFEMSATARNLDLGIVTKTFSFGAIAGRFDADLKDLQMVGLTPVQFDAQIASSPGVYRRYFSLGALRDITALGVGEEKSTISTRGFDFGYDRIALGCRLSNGVCALSGIAPKGKGVLLMKGSGLPSINIVGYNPNIAWQSMLDRINAMIAGKEKLELDLENGIDP